MSKQRTATFQTYGMKPNFSDMVKARAKTLQNPVPIAFLRTMLYTLSIPGALPFYSLVRTMRIRSSGSTSATKSLSSSVSVTLSWGELSGVK